MRQSLSFVKAPCVLTLLGLLTWWCPSGEHRYLRNEGWTHDSIPPVPGTIRLVLLSGRSVSWIFSARTCTGAICPLTGWCPRNVTSSILISHLGPHGQSSRSNSLEHLLYILVLLRGFARHEDVVVDVSHNGHITQQPLTGDAAFSVDSLDTIICQYTLKKSSF